MTLKEMYETNIANAKTELQRLESEFAALPSEFHILETHVWEKIREFFMPKA